MIVITANDSSAEENLDPFKDANWFDLPSIEPLQRMKRGPGKTAEVS